MTRSGADPQVVACCKPLAVQHATNNVERATARATSMQQSSLKALALLALGRNSVRNEYATAAEKPRNSVPVASPGLLREKLRVKADPEGIQPAQMDRLRDEDDAACAGLDSDVLATYIRALAEGDLREHGRVPVDETAPALCRRCGPVWVHPAIASVAPVADGWPRLLGCPWCHVRNREAIPRPPA